jgi:hypothetical protein
MGKLIPQEDLNPEEQSCDANIAYRHKDVGNKVILLRPFVS